jgi:hypothetical protein
MRRLPNAPYIRTATALLAVSALLAMVSLVRAVRVTPVQASENPVTTALNRSTSTPPVAEIDFEAVGANDIFQPTRNPLQYRYRMPGDPLPSDAAATPEPARPVVLGTVIATDGDHFATCQLPGGRPTVVRVGDRLGDYTVTLIDRTRVVFKDAAGKSIEVAATRPGMGT